MGLGALELAVSVMKKFPKSAGVQERGLDAMWFMAESGRYADAVVAAGAVDLATSALEAEYTHPGVQVSNIELQYP